MHGTYDDSAMASSAQSDAQVQSVMLYRARDSPSCIIRYKLRPYAAHGAISSYQQICVCSEGQLLSLTSCCADSGNDLPAAMGLLDRNDLMTEVHFTAPFQVVQEHLVDQAPVCAAQRCRFACSLHCSMKKIAMTVCTRQATVIQSEQDGGHTFCTPVEGSDTVYQAFHLVPRSCIRWSLEGY